MKQAVLLITLFMSFLFVLTLNAQDKKKLNFYGDFRFRIEMDRNSKKTNGDLRDDRDRLRYRFRYGFKYKADDHFEFGGRLRTGNVKNQQSPHVTIGKEFQSDAFSLDKAYMKAKTNGGLWAWVGKNNMPFWEKKGFLWNGDINPEGVAVGGKFKMGENADLVPVLGYFILGHSGKKFGSDNRLAVAQLKCDGKFGENELNISTGYINGILIPNTPDLTGYYFLDYGIWATSLQFKLKNAGLTIALDYFQNLFDYEGNPDMADVYEDQKTGYVASLLYNIKKFQFGYYYAHIEKYAVIDYLAQDDWVRWGNNDYTRSSNFGGHEFRVKYKVTDKVNTVFRAYLVEGLVTTGKALETGTRVRLDFNIKF